MVKCVFCGKETYAHQGVHYIHNDGSVSYFCSSKCRKNSLKLGRDKRKLKWTEAYRITAAKAVVSHAKAAEKVAMADKKKV